MERGINMKKKELDSNTQLELLKTIVKDIFGYNTEIDFTHYEYEPNKITIVDIEWTDELIEILSRLRQDFYIDFEITKKENIGQVLSIVLYPIER